ncbi:MAG: hypothetical protein IAX21_07050 [Candidatus Bathyarchaeota archaeon]|nr:MAG: hypothetical protein NUK63_10375 [Candidatus Bathyarchaeum tardum]WNZ28419.1 MAG: hypothetical protein IAX21_07050 [Candidatus Bathyarchaeota archaeon]
MKKSKKQVTFKQRYLGIVFIVIVQAIVGTIHLFFGLALISGNFSFSTYPTMFSYSIYTLVYGSLTIIFTYWIWKEKQLGWIGTVTIALFVITVDSLAVFNVTNFLGIPAPKVAAIGEIPYSMLALVYLLQNHVRAKYNI